MVKTYEEFKALRKTIINDFGMKVVKTFDFPGDKKEQMMGKVNQATKKTGAAAAEKRAEKRRTNMWDGVWNFVPGSAKNAATTMKAFFNKDKFHIPKYHHKKKQVLICENPTVEAGIDEWEGLGENAHKTHSGVVGNRPRTPMTSATSSVMLG